MPPGLCYLRPMWLSLAVVLLAGVEGAASGVPEALALEQAGDDAAAVEMLAAVAAEHPGSALPRIELLRIELKRGRLERLRPE